MNKTSKIVFGRDIETGLPPDLAPIPEINIEELGPIPIETPDPKINKKNGKKLSEQHYVDGKLFTKQITEYVRQVRAAEVAKTPKPKVPEEMGRVIFAIASNLSSKQNFSGYSYKDEMISNAVVNCLLYLDRYNPDKIREGNNWAGFSYITQIIWNSFLRTIQSEQKQAAIKYRAIQNCIEMEGEHKWNSDPEHSAHDSLRESVVPVKYKPRKRKEKKDPATLGLDV